MAKRKAHDLGPQINLPCAKKQSLRPFIIPKTVEERVELNKSRARIFAAQLAARAQEQGIFQGTSVPFELQDEVLEVYKRAKAGKPLDLPGLKTRYHPDTGERIYSKPEKRAARLRKKNPQQADRYLARVKSIMAQTELARKSSRPSGSQAIPYHSATHDQVSQPSALHSSHNDQTLLQQQIRQRDVQGTNSVTASGFDDELESDYSNNGFINPPDSHKSLNPISKHDFAERAMAKMGYQKGSGLGKDASGITVPVEVKLRPRLAGIGADSVSIDTEAITKAAKRVYEASKQDMTEPDKSGFSHSNHSGQTPKFDPTADPFAGLRQDQEDSDSITFEDSCHDTADQAQGATSYMDTPPSLAGSSEKPTIKPHNLRLGFETTPSLPQSSKRERESQRLRDFQADMDHNHPSTIAERTRSKVALFKKENADEASKPVTDLGLEALYTQPELDELMSLARALIAKQGASLTPKSMSAMQLRKAGFVSQTTPGQSVLPPNFFAIRDLQPLSTDIVIDDEFLVRCGTSRSGLEKELVGQRENLVAALLHSVRGMTRDHLVIPEHAAREQRYLLAHGQVRDTHSIIKFRLICLRLELVLNGIDPTAFAPPTGLRDKDIKYSDGSQYVKLARKHAMSSNWSPVGVSQVPKQSTAQSNEQIAADLTKKFGGLWYNPPQAQQAQATTLDRAQNIELRTTGTPPHFRSQMEQAGSSSTVYSEIYGTSQPRTAAASSAPLTKSTKKWIPPHLRAVTPPVDTSSKRTSPHIRDNVPPAEPSAAMIPPSVGDAALLASSSTRWTPPHMRGSARLASSSTAWVAPSLRSTVAQNAKVYPYDAPPVMNDHQAAAVRRWFTSDVAPSLPVPKPTKGYLASTLSRPLRSCDTKPLLIICDLNGTLICRNKSIKTSFKKRPGLTRFLDYIFSDHKVMVWTSARQHNMLGITAKLFTPAQQAACIKLWARETLGLTTQQYDANPQVYKRLEIVWRDESIQKTHSGYAQGGRWSQKNTILIDDSVLKTVGQPYNAINVPELVAGMLQAEEQTALLRQVEAYIEEARHYDNVSAFFRANPFVADGRWWNADETNVEKFVREESVQVEEPVGSPRR